MMNNYEKLDNNKRRKLNNYNKIQLKIKNIVKIDKECNTDKELKNYKIFVFDLDHTLYLHKVHEFDVYYKTYHDKVKNLLTYLKDNNKLLYIATHNTSPDYYLNKINIKELFDDIIMETKDLCHKKNSIKEYTSKKDMILEILEKNIQYTLEDVLFFDDHPYNIKQVNSIGVKCIYVDELKGINFNDIY
jgi:HAD superfamily phosphatase (TIGR01681 family)